jgi:hypothetical protein
MATEQICPVVGTTTTVLPPNHPHYDADKPGLRCPVTNATTDHHHVLHEHPGSAAIPSDSMKAMDASACPALKNAEKKEPLVEATCPIVGPVSAYLPPEHPDPAKAEKGAVCPVTKATLEHHESKVHKHPALHAGVCPVAGKAVEA